MSTELSYKLQNPELSIQVHNNKDLSAPIFIECNHLNHDGSYAIIEIIVYPIIDDNRISTSERRFNCVLKNSKGFEVGRGVGQTAIIAKEKAIIVAKNYVNEYHSPSKINIRKF